MLNMPTNIGLLLIPIMMVLIGAVVRRGFRLRRRSASPRTSASSTRCSCGYALVNLDRIRCPECGRVFGFDATPQELGLTDDELRKATEAREQRRERERLR